MKIKLNSNHRAGIAVWIVVIIMVVFVVVIAGITFVMVNAIKRIVPPPQPDEDGTVQTLHMGDKYAGGTVTGFVPHSGNLIDDESAIGQTNILVYASDVPNPVEWTNLVLAVPFTTNTVTLEQLTNGAPIQRYYNIKVSIEQ